MSTCMYKKACLDQSKQTACKGQDYLPFIVAHNPEPSACTSRVRPPAGQKIIFTELLMTRQNKAGLELDLHTDTISLLRRLTNHEAVR